MWQRKNENAVLDCGLLNSPSLPVVTAGSQPECLPGKDKHMHTESATKFAVMQRSTCVCSPFQYMLVCCSLVVLVIVSEDLGVVEKTCTTRLYH